MWALVKADQVIRIINGPKAVTIEDVNHPATIFRSWTAEELKAIGIYPYSEQSTDTAFYKYSNSSYEIGADAVKQVWGNETAKDMDDVTIDDVTTLGLKSIWVNSTKSSSHSRLSSTDWYVTRLSEETTAVPSDVSTYRDAVRAACNTIETAINACADVDALKAMFVTPVDGDGKATGNAPMYDWPDEL